LFAAFAVLGRYAACETVTDAAEAAKTYRKPDVIYKDTFEIIDKDRPITIEESMTLFKAAKKLREMGQASLSLEVEHIAAKLTNM
jgi:hypothetical protein